MEHQNISVRRTGIKYGFYTGLASLVYFLFLIVTGLIEVVELHFLTGVILVVGICVAISRFKKARNGMIDYMQGIGLGLGVGLVSSLMYAVVQVLGDYLFGMVYTFPYRADNFFGDNLAIWLLAVTWIIFGVVLGPFIAYMAMQYYKRPDHKME
jgi:hypothetical protein